MLHATFCQHINDISIYLTIYYLSLPFSLFLSRASVKEGRKIKRSAYYRADSTSGMVMRHLYVSPCIYRRPLPPPQPLCAPSTVFDIPFLSSSPSPSSHPSIFPYHYEILLSPPPTHCSLTFVPRTLVSFLGGKLGKGKIRPL